MDIRVRFAPSPTGSLHLGVVRTAIFNYLFSQKKGGKLILRIEDTDQERSTVESYNEILSSLKWLGIEWDEGPYKQSERLDIYNEYAKKLILSGDAYRCYASDEEINYLKEQAKKENKIYKYPRIWRDKVEPPDGRKFVVRFKCPDNKEIKFRDSLRGNITIQSSNLDDFIIIKGDGFPTYNFASSVDDMEMKISNVIRGEDHLSNTPKQVLIFNALSGHQPEFTHVSMILGNDKTKLSKRHGAESINSFREKGFLPISIINYLARLGWSYGDQEIFSINEMKQFFSLDNLNKSPAVFDIEKFSWVNSNQIKKQSNDLLLSELDIKFIPEIDSNKALDIAKNKSSNMVQLKESLLFCESRKIKVDQTLTKLINNEQKSMLKNFSNYYIKVNPNTHDEIKECFNNFLTENNLKMKELAFPLRIILTGTKSSPGIFDILDLLGAEIIKERIEENCL